MKIRPLSRPARLAAALLLPALLGGCLFSARDPVAPTTGVSIPYLPRTSPVNVWENLQISLINSDSFGWEENISPNFTYEADTEAQDLFPGVFDAWNYEKEIAFIQAFYTSGVTITADLRNDEFQVPEPAGSESLWDGVIYYLTVTSDGSETRYRGRANITFRLEGNFWYIYKWVDEGGENNPDNPTQLLSTMGVLRGTFGSN